MFDRRYERNYPALSPEDQNRLKSSGVLVAGCGGLGGYVIECLARIGVGSITVADGDVFEETNLNRQLYSSENNLGEKKAVRASKRISEINSAVNVRAVTDTITENNIREIIGNAALIIDAVDNYRTRLLLAQAANRAGIPLIHGAIAGWTARIYTLYPGDDMMEFFCSGEEVNFAGNLSFMAALCAAIQVGEAVKLLTGKNSREKKLIEIDLKNDTFDSLIL